MDDKTFSVAVIFLHEIASWPCLRPLQITGIAEDCWCVGLRKRKLVLGVSSFVTIQELSYVCAVTCLSLSAE